jgi:hypothetical protein
VKTVKFYNRLLPVLAVLSATTLSGSIFSKAQSQPVPVQIQQNAGRTIKCAGPNELPPSTEVMLNLDSTTACGEQTIPLTLLETRVRDGDKNSPPRVLRLERLPRSKRFILWSLKPMTYNASYFIDGKWVKLPVAKCGVEVPIRAQKLKVWTPASNVKDEPSRMSGAATC